MQGVFVVPIESLVQQYLARTPRLSALVPPQRFPLPYITIVIFKTQQAGVSCSHEVSPLAPILIVYLPPSLCEPVFHSFIRLSLVLFETLPPLAARKTTRARTAIAPQMWTCALQRAINHSRSVVEVLSLVTSNVQQVCVRTLSDTGPSCRSDPINVGDETRLRKYI